MNAAGQPSHSYSKCFELELVGSYSETADLPGERERRVGERNKLATKNAEKEKETNKFSKSPHLNWSR